MSEEEVKKCPKCDGIMEDARSLTTSWNIVEMEVSLKKKKAIWFGDEITPFYCKKCGYIELYLKKEWKPIKCEKCGKVKVRTKKNK